MTIDNGPRPRAYDTPAGEPASYVACRTLGHAWDDDPLPVPVGTPRPGGTVPLWLRCHRCATERHDLCSPYSGDVEARRYVYPPGYNVRRPEVIERATWRATYLRLVGTITSRQYEEGRQYRRQRQEQLNR